MRVDAFIGTIVLCGLVTPAIVWLVLCRWAGLSAVVGRVWLALYGLGALMCIIVLPRKHIESALLTRLPRGFWVYNLAQVDNELWEQVGKLLAMAIVLWLVGEPLRVLFTNKKAAVAIGYWTGLSYGFGEALILAILFAVPAWAPFFGINTFTPYMVGWPYVQERLFAMHAHGIMGGLIGLGLYGFFALGSRMRLVGFFVLAMLYHHFVDGLIIAAGFAPGVAQIIVGLGALFVLLEVVAGLVLLWLAYRSQRSVVGRRSSSDPQDACA